MTNPLLIDVPTEFESSRLLIRCPRPGDGPMFGEAVRESLSELRPWISWAGEFPDSHWERMMREKLARYIERAELFMLLVDKETGRFVGSSGLHRPDWRVPRMDVGYWVRSSCARRGYVTEAVQRIADLAFDVLHVQRLEIRAESENERSAAVARRCGFELEATLRKFDRHHTTNELIDLDVYVRFAK